MREIKFRGMSPYYGWVYGMYVDSFIVNGVVEATDEYIALEEWYPIDIDTVGQYTGLKDKNGVEIYEGDIVRWLKEFISPADMRTKHKIDSNKEIHQKESGEWVMGEVGNALSEELFNVEVIGSIYEDKELLEEN